MKKKAYHRMRDMEGQVERIERVWSEVMAEYLRHEELEPNSLRGVFFGGWLSGHNWRRIVKNPYHYSPGDRQPGWALQKCFYDAWERGFSLAQNQLVSMRAHVRASFRLLDASHNLGRRLH